MNLGGHKSAHNRSIRGSGQGPSGTQANQPKWSLSAAHAAHPLLGWPLAARLGGEGRDSRRPHCSGHQLFTTSSFLPPPLGSLVYLDHLHSLVLASGGAAAVSSKIPACLPGTRRLLWARSFPRTCPLVCPHQRLEPLLILSTTGFCWLLGPHTGELHLSAGSHHPWAHGSICGWASFCF